MWDLQLSNWLVSAAGTSATFIVFVTFILFVVVIVRQVLKIKAQKQIGEALNILPLAGTLLLFGLVLTGLFSFQSNAPKYRLEVIEPKPQQGIVVELPEVQNLAPEEISAEASSKRLEALREAQKQSTSAKDEDGQ